MRALLRLDWRQTWRSRKNFVVMLLLLIGCAGYFFVAQQQHLGDTRALILDRQDQLKVNLERVARSVNPTRGPAKRTAQNLNDQVAQIGLARIGYEFNQPKTFLSAWRQLDQLAITGAKAHYAGMPNGAAGLPSVNQAQREYAQVQALQARQQGLIGRVRDTASYLNQLLPLLALILPVIGLIIASDIWLSSSAHTSITATLPVSFAAQAGSKMLTRWGFGWGSGVLAVLAAVGSSALAGNGLGQLSYPWALPLWRGFHLTSLLGGVGWWLLDWAIVMLFLSALMLVLNVVTQDVYLSLVGGGALLVIAQLWPQLNLWLWWTPLAGLAPQQVVDGTVRQASGIAWNGSLVTGVVLLVWSGVLLALFRWLATRREA